MDSPAKKPTNYWGTPMTYIRIGMPESFHCASFWKNIFLGQAGLRKCKTSLWMA